MARARDRAPLSPSSSQLHHLSCWKLKPSTDPVTWMPFLPPSAFGGRRTSSGSHLAAPGRIDPGADGFSALVERGICDASGAPADAPSMPVYVRDCMFRIDETTDPGQVGAHTVKTHELIGAHNGGKNADTGKADSGVFTREAEDLNVKDTPGAKRVYLGRLNDSPWAQFEPAPDHFDIEKMAPRKVGRIEMSQPDEMPKIPVSAPNPVPAAKGKKGKKGKKGG